MLFEQELKKAQEYWLSAMQSLTQQCNQQEAELAENPLLPSLRDILANGQTPCAAPAAPAAEYHLNVGGTIVIVDRETLTHFPASRLGRVFREGWQELLPKDKASNIFLDMDPKQFFAIMDFVVEWRKQRPEDQLPPHPELATCLEEEASRWGLLALCEELGLAALGNAAEAEALGTVQKLLDKQLDLLTEAVKERAKEPVLEQVIKALHDSLGSLQQTRPEHTVVSRSVAALDTVKQWQQDLAQREVLAENTDVEKEKRFMRHLAGRGVEEGKQEPVQLVTVFAKGLETATVLRATLCQCPKLAELLTQVGKQERAPSLRLPYDPVAVEIVLQYLRMKSMGQEVEGPSLQGRKMEKLKVLVKALGLEDEFPVAGHVNSALLCKAQKLAFFRDFPEFQDVEPEPLYRASRDGWMAATFHALCNQQGPTVTVVRSSQGHVFGGYSDAAWDASGQYKNSQAAFLFKLGQHQEVHVSRHVAFQNPGKAIYCNGNYGPTFGSNHDLYVHLNGTKGCQTNLGGTYSRDPGNLQFLGEGQNCQLTEVEVFAIGHTDSAILSEPQRAALLQELGGLPAKKLRLLYRGSRDGFTAQSFHQRCDNAGSTVTVVKSAQGHVFGGYSDLPWDSSGQNKESQAAFLFKLGQNDAVSVSRHKVFQNHGHAVHCNGSYGPTFGGSHDFQVLLNGAASARSNLGHTYDPGNLQHLSESQNCQLTEVEVFALCCGDSAILSEQQMAALLRELHGKCRLRLLYRGSGHGFTAQSFHQRCDQVARTVTVLKSAEGHVFGGYSDVIWDSSGQWKHSTSAFLFKLGQNEEVNFSRHNVVQYQQNAVQCHGSYGPTFGNGPNLRVNLNGPKSTSAAMQLQCTYNLAEFLAESQSPALTEVEVFAVLSDDSALLSMAQQAALLQELAQVQAKQLRLLFRGSRDGFTGQSFHQRCDNAGRTVTVLKSAQGHVFGGYSDVPWDSSGQYKNSQSAFLFKLGQNDAVSFSRHNILSHANAVHCNSSYGPTFGSGHDLHVTLSGPTAASTAAMSLGNTYNRGEGNLQYLSESQSCVLADIEVYALD